MKLPEVAPADNETPMRGIPLLRRLVKYTPALVMGVLVVAWCVSVGREFGIDVPLPTRGRAIGGFENGTFYFGYNFVAFSRLYFFSGDDVGVSHTSTGLGRFESELAYHPDGSLWRWWIDVPIAVLLSLALPIAVGAITKFRFRLWQYLAYTALIALELAYYWRWQG